MDTNFEKYINNKDLVLQEKSTRLVRLKHEMIETLREWRNDPEIAQHMFSQDYITKESQEKWFKKIDSAKDCLEFVIFDKDIPVGRLSIIKIDCKKNEAEGGMVIGNKKYLNKGYAFKAYMIAIDFIFYSLQFDCFYGTVKKDNLQSIRFSTQFGFIKNKNIDDNFDLYILTKANYEKNRERLYNFWFLRN